MHRSTPTREPPWNESKLWQVLQSAVAHHVARRRCAAGGHEIVGHRGIVRAQVPFRQVARTIDADAVRQGRVETCGRLGLKSIDILAHRYRGGCAARIAGRLRGRRSARNGCRRGGDVRDILRLALRDVSRQKMRRDRTGGLNPGDVQGKRRRGRGVGDLEVDANCAVRCNFCRDDAEIETQVHVLNHGLRREQSLVAGSDLFARGPLPA